MSVMLANLPMPHSTKREPIFVYIVVSVTRPDVPLETTIMERLAINMFNINPYNHKKIHNSKALDVKSPKILKTNFL